MAAGSWYLLVHQLPARPIYLRARIGQRLARAGALSLKNSVYLLPRNPESLERLRSIVREARAAGGAAYVSEAEFVDGLAADELVARFREERNADYEALGEEIRRVAASMGRGSGVRPSKATDLARLTRLKKRHAEIEAIDFFAAPARKTSRALLASLEKRLREKKKVRPAISRTAAARFEGCVWATRPGVQVDRIASAWLIRRFIDSAARFRFVDPKEQRRAGELRFDMPGADFTHEGDACTFETLARLIGTPDPALRQIAEIVHDIDLKDGKFARPDAAGVQQILLGILLACPGDEDRLERGFTLFDDLYASFRRRILSPAESPSHRVKTRKGGS